MAESTLALTRDTLREITGDWMGYGRGETAGEETWTSQQERVIDEIVTSGQSFVLKTPAIPGIDKGGYDWTWLHPVGSVILASGASEIDAPDDFGGFEVGSTVTAAPTDGGSVSGDGIRIISESKIRDALARSPDATGSPEVIGTYWLKNATIAGGQRQVIKVYPTADQEYRLTFQYYIQADAISGTRPYPLGGAQHRETYKAACLAAAEIYRDNRKGPMWANFIDQLTGSIQIDRRNKSPNLGYNRDNSDQHGELFFPGRPFFSTITIGGVEP